MSRLKRDIYSGKITKILSKAEDEAFCQLVWAVDALQSGRASAAAHYLQFPQEAAIDAIPSRQAIYKWELESLITQLLITPKAKPGKNRRRITNCGSFNTAAVVVRNLRKLENEETGLYLERFGILSEMHRICQRQFPWQRGYANIRQIYLYAYIFGQGACRDFFEKTYGVSFDNFSLTGFALYSAFQQLPICMRNLSLEAFDISEHSIHAALELLSASIAQARADALSMVSETNEKHGNVIPTAYRQSFLRRFPIIAFGEGGVKLRCPLPELIILRITSGVYYDLVSGPSNLRNEASDRFERYCCDYIAKTLPNFSVSRQRKYSVGKQQFDTPDVLIESNGEIVAVMECKATKLSFAAQFTEDPFSEAERAYEEIAKGAFQLWRFFAHVRQRFYADNTHVDMHGVVLTLDPWMTMSRELEEQVLSAAKEMAKEDCNIIPEDCQPITFCSIADLEHMLDRSSEASFLRTLAASKECNYHGWQLQDVHRDYRSQDELSDPKPFPFEVHDVLPWWRLAEEFWGTHPNLTTPTP